MEPWYKVATPRSEVRKGRSFNPDEFAIALEQVVAGTAPEDYREPGQFFARTCWTRALREHVGMVLRRLAGRTDNTAPVLTLVTQFGGGKTHTLTTMYHLANAGTRASAFPGVSSVLSWAGLPSVPHARVAVFVGNAWDPQEGRETPWIDLARQLAGAQGVEALGTAAKEVPPGTEALARVFEAANAPVLFLFDEVLNFVNRHRSLAEPFHAFIQNLTVAMTGTTRGAAVISLPRSQVEMTDWDLQWQEKITKVVRRVAKDLIANDEAEISEVVRRRLFEDLGHERVRKSVARAYADWCFERRAQLPPEWTAVDSATTEAKAREYLRDRFEACYPFHPATLSVFQRKWQALPQYQQTRGTLAMLAQWIAWVYREGFMSARREPLITLGSAPLEDPGFRGVVLGQLGEPRLLPAIEADIAGERAHARVLDAGTQGLLRDIHRRVGTAILFESSGGQTENVAHLPEVRFALCEPGVDTTSIDSAAAALEDKAYFIRRVGSDGFRIHHRPTLKKVVHDRRASLDEQSEIKPAIRKLVEEEFRRGAAHPLVFFPADSSEIPDSPRLTLVVATPEEEWVGAGPLRERIAEWTTRRGQSPRLYPAALVWCLRKPGSDLRAKVELWLAWQKVVKEIRDGTLGIDFDPSEQDDVQHKVKEAGDEARDEVSGGYRFVVVFDPREAGGLRVIDLAAHATAAKTMSGRVLDALTSSGLLNSGVGAGYIDRSWPPALKEAGAWPLASLRQSFLNGSLTRLADPDATLRQKIVEFVKKGDFGLASGPRPGGTYERVWFEEDVSPDEVRFESDVFLLTKAKAEALTKPAPAPAPVPAPGPGSGAGQQPAPPASAGEGTTSPGATPSLSRVSGTTGHGTPTGPGTRTIQIAATVPPEVWNRLGIKLIPKLRSGRELQVGVEFQVRVDAQTVPSLLADIRQILDELGLSAQARVEEAAAAGEGDPPKQPA